MRSFNGTSQPTGSSHRLLPHRDARRVEARRLTEEWPEMPENMSCCLDDVAKRRAQARSAILKV